MVYGIQFIIVNLSSLTGGQNLIYPEYKECEFTWISRAKKTFLQLNKRPNNEVREENREIDRERKIDRKRGRERDTYL